MNDNTESRLSPAHGGWEWSKGKIYGYRGLLGKRRWILDATEYRHVHHLDQTGRKTIGRGELRGRDERKQHLTLSKRTHARTASGDGRWIQKGVRAKRMVKSGTGNGRRAVTAAV